MEVKIIRSKRRQRTVSGRLVEDVLLIRAPLMIPAQHLDKIVAGFKVKFEKSKLKSDLDREKNLAQLAEAINKQYFNNWLKLASIEYVTTQNSKFGCCDYRASAIRISHRIGLMPAWVRKYVVMHEMAHLIEPNHSRAFWDIVSRYRLCERARGYLIAAGQYTKDE